MFDTLVILDYIDAVLRRTVKTPVLRSTNFRQLVCLIICGYVVMGFNSQPTHSTVLHRNSFVTRSLFLYVWILICVCLIILLGRELAFTFAICYGRSVCLSSVCRLWRWCALLRRLNFSAIFFHHTIAQGLYFSDTKNRRWGTPLSPWNLLSKWPTPLSNSAISTNIGS